MPIEPVNDISELSTLELKWLHAMFDGARNQTEAVDTAGYECSTQNSKYVIGSNNFRKCSKLISKWLDEGGLSEDALKLRLYKGLDVKETKFFPYRDKEGKQHIDEIQVECISEQRRYLDMGMRAKGMFEKDNEQRQTIVINAEPASKDAEAGK